MVCMNSIVGDMEGNSAKMRGIIESLSSTGSDMICFPELSLTGYSTDQSPEYAMDVDDPRVTDIVDMTSDSDVAICFGFVETGPYITQVIAEGGRIVGVYRKTHLGEREAAVFMPGNELPVFRTSKAVVGIQTCWESHFPQITTSHATKGADIVLMPHASGLSRNRRRDSWNKILPARAYDNTLFVASCNMVGDNGSGTVFGGGACIIDVRGNVIAEDYSGKCTVTADLDPTDMERIRAPGYESMKDLYFLDKVRWDLFRCHSGPQAPYGDDDDSVFTSVRQFRSCEHHLERRSPEPVLLE